jgi:nucleoid DNA-binding protein
MTQKELVKNVADASGLTQVNVGACLKALAQEVQRAVVGGDKVVLPNLGTFTRTFHEARQTKGGFGNFDVPAAFRPRFKALKGFKDAVNGK